MAALNFPASPALNATYVANGLTFKWDGEKWLSIVDSTPKIDLGTENNIPYLDTSKSLITNANLNFKNNTLSIGGSLIDDWAIDRPNIQLGGVSGSYITGATSVTIGQGFYRSATGFKFLPNLTGIRAAAAYQPNGGDHIFVSSGFGNPGDSVTFVELARLTQEGNLGLGTYPSARLDINGTVRLRSTVTLDGGTANGVPYLNASKVLASGSALTFDGTTLATSGALTVAGNTTLGDATTDTVTVNGYMGVGGAGQSNIGLWLRNTLTSATNQYGMYASVTAASADTTQFNGIAPDLFVPNAAFTYGTVAAIRVLAGSKGAAATATNWNGLYIQDQTQGTNNYGITSLVSAGSNKWNIYASGTAANYFAGNVGIGTTSPLGRLHVATTSGTTNVYFQCLDTSQSIINFGGTTTPAKGRISYSDNTDTLWFSTNSTARLHIDSSGNLGLGVIPGAWASGFKGFDLGPVASFASESTTTDLTRNAVYTTGWTYKTSSTATLYRQSSSGQHGWYTAPSGTAGAAITFTQAMTLTAAGDLTVIGDVTAFSDERLKTNWNSAPINYIEKLAKVKSGTYTRVDTARQQAGVSAQDMQRLLPESVIVADDSSGTLSLAYGNAAMVSAVELAKRVVEQDRRIAALELALTKFID